MRIRASSSPHESTLSPRERIAEGYRLVRRTTDELMAPLSSEDAQGSATAETSPPKWHLAHTTWFFENFVLARWERDFAPFHPRFAYLFNSYYETQGAFLPKPHRADLTRPSLDEIRAYRQAVDQRVIAALNALPDSELSEFYSVLRLGMNHEQQHQELLLMDVKRNFFANPLRPAYLKAPVSSSDTGLVPERRWKRFEGGLIEIGAGIGEAFAYDNEGDRHRVWLDPFEIASQPVTAREYSEFIEDGGYARPEFWLSEGWETARREQWQAPLYWEMSPSGWQVMSLYGMRPLHADEPVSHLSYFEAQAFATWAGCRLPTEAEWEHAAQSQPIDGKFLEDRAFHPVPVRGSGDKIHGMHGGLWEWTQSAYLPYPRHRPLAGCLGEYNAKFMCNQFVLRGGSFATPRSHYRTTYRNYYAPAMRWQFSGVRLAKDAT